MDTQHHTPAVKISEFKSGGSSIILRGDPQLASAALNLARHVRLKGLRRGSYKQVGQVLELMKFAESACDSPLLCPADMHDDHNFQDPRKYADSLVKLARDVRGCPSVGGVRFCAPRQVPALAAAAGGRFDGH